MVHNMTSFNITSNLKEASRTESDVDAIYQHSCPNCGRDFESWRASRGLACTYCTRPTNREFARFYDAVEFMRERKEAESYIRYRSLLNEVNELFKKLTNNDMWPIQSSWALRALKGYSFAITAPTGVGKTVFGIVFTYYLATRHKKRCYLILPTSVLVKQAYERMTKLNELDGKEVKIAAFWSGMKNSKEMKEKIFEGEYDILITTSQFLSQNFESIKSQKFDFIFVDDVDSFLKAYRNVERSLILLGFTHKEVEEAYKLIRENKIGEKEFERKGQIIISTATGKTKGRAYLLYRVMLGFTIGSTTWQLRNVINFYRITDNPLTDLKFLINKLGRGGLIFVPHDLGHEYASEIEAFLKREGLRALQVTAENKLKALDAFVKGDVDVLIGVAHYYGILVRGLDLPELIRYAIFLGSPRFKFNLRELNDVSSISTTSIRLYRHVSEEEARTIDLIISFLKRASRNEIDLINKALRGEASPGRLEKFYKAFIKAREIVLTYLSDEEKRKEIEKEGELIIRRENGMLYVYIPDTRTYIQASGRTSRTYVGGITRGISIILERPNDRPILEGLMRVFRYYLEEPWEELREDRLEDEIRKVNEDRDLVKLAKEGRIATRIKGIGRTALFIVESPNKARTIANFYGRPSRRAIGDIIVYEVTRGDLFLNIVATVGHIMDLTMDTLGNDIYGVLKLNGAFLPVYNYIKRCTDCGYQFTSTTDKCPRCGSVNVVNKSETVRTLRELASEVDEVLIGTDPDPEGEKIAWDVYNMLRPINPNIYRVEFHEVTKKAIEDAIKHRRRINKDLVNAQIVRRIEDRWIGFALSQKLWSVFKSRNLSAGRVQTPVLGWIIARTEEAKRKVPKTIILLQSPHDEAKRIRVEVGKRLGVKSGRLEALVREIEVQEIEKNPLPPYTTDTLLSEAAAVLKMGVNKIMSLAQDLFEIGLITYHRTDSTRVSDKGLEVAREYISRAFGENYFKPRRWGEGGAHECIRPTRPWDTRTLIDLLKRGIFTPVIEITRDHIRLYDLIFRRFMASQMVPEKVLYQKARILIETESIEVEGECEILEKSFSQIYSIGRRKVPKLEPNERLIGKVLWTGLTKAVREYTQAEVISQMKAKGLGRPSTYAKIVETLLKRKYVVEVGRGYLKATEIGKGVYEYLVKHYENMISETRTAKLEEKMDKVMSGEIPVQEILKELYNEVTPIISELSKEEVTKEYYKIEG